MTPACVEVTSAAVGEPAKLRGEILPNRQPAYLSEAIRATVHRERSLAKVIADVLACKPKHVTDLADPMAHVPLKAYEIPGLVQASGDFAVLDAIEAQVGRVAFRLPALPAMGGAIVEELSRTVTGFGEFLKTNGTALADGRLDDAEVRCVLLSLDQMIAGLCEYRELVLDKAAQDRDLVRSA